jgi:hypothetical protein
MRQPGDSSSRADRPQKERGLKQRGLEATTDRRGFTVWTHAFVFGRHQRRDLGKFDKSSLNCDFPKSEPYCSDLDTASVQFLRMTLDASPLTPRSPQQLRINRAIEG